MVILKIRKPVVAGHFYPINSEELKKFIEASLLKNTKKETALGVISPHAGYVYSGTTAGKTLSSIKIPKTVIVLCPNHTGMGAPISLHPAEQWETPLGTINVDMNIMNKIQTYVKEAELNQYAQLREHALEVQLPFLQCLNPEFKLVPITLANISYGLIKKLGQCLGDIMFEMEKEGKEIPLILASSDMTHFEDADSAKNKDMMAIEKIKEMNTIELLGTVESNDISMCGIFPICTMIESLLEYMARKNNTEPDSVRNLLKAELVDYTNSGFVTKDFSNVVAYAGIMIKSK